MSLELITAQLSETLGHLAQIEHAIQQQQVIIAELDERGSNGGSARCLLMLLQQSRHFHERERDRLEAELRESRSAPVDHSALAVR